MPTHFQLSSGFRTADLSYAARHAAGAVIGLVARLYRHMAQTLRNRRTLQKMSGMTARELADIGLTRMDVRDAATVTGDDAGAFLALRVRERARSRTMFVTR